MSKIYVKLAAFISVLIISFIDYLIVIDISLSIIYLLPISLISWYGEKWFSFLLALISAMGWLIAESVAKQDLYFVLILWNTAVRLVTFLVVAYLLSNLKNSYEKEKFLARTDVLTGVVNRRFFLELLNLETKRSYRYQHCLTLAYFDVDNFKQINDQFGHNEGDKLLTIIAQTIKQQIRETDTIARLGGDEFVILLPETNYEAAQNVLKRLQEQLIAGIENYCPPVSLSIGVVTFLTLPDSVDKILEKADSLMYQVKNSGKNDIKYQIVA